MCAPLPSRPTSSLHPAILQAVASKSLCSDRSRRVGLGPRTAPPGRHGSSCSCFSKGPPGHCSCLAEPRQRQVSDMPLLRQPLRPRAAGMTDSQGPQIFVTSGIKRGSQPPTHRSSDMGPSKTWVPYTVLIGFLHFGSPGSLRGHAYVFTDSGAPAVSKETHAPRPRSPARFRGWEPGPVGLGAGHATTWRRSLLPENSVLLDSIISQDKLLRVSA